MADAGPSGGAARPARLPRWTRQEILVLIQGKKVAERRKAGLSLASSVAASPVEPKWATVAAYCRRHGVSRGPVQCRKRWSNLASDYKKIKDWETRRGSEAAGEESFWIMRNDRRRERKLPGFFDKEVYDILDGAAAAVPEEEDEEDEEEETAAAATAAAPAPALALDCGRTAAVDALFSDSEQEPDEEDKEEPPDKEAAEVEVQKGGSSTEGEEERRKRERDEGGGGLAGQVIEILERNSKALMSHMEAQNVNQRLDREQRKEQGDSLVVVLGKVADALGRIADKL